MEDNQPVQPIEGTDQSALARLISTTTVEAPNQDGAPTAGLPEGHVIETPAGEPNEVIVYDYNEGGAVIGWHKEIANG